MLNGFFAYHHQQAKDNLDRIRKDAYRKQEHKSETDIMNKKLC